MNIGQPPGDDDGVKSSSRHHRSSLKKKAFSHRVSKEKQRRDALSRQHNARRDFADHARRVVVHASKEEELESKTKRGRGEEYMDDDEGEEGKEEKKRMKRTTTKTGDGGNDDDVEVKKTERGELQLPEYMTDVPTDLGENWLCQPKPRGKRCAVIAARGRTSAFDTQGKRITLENKKKYFQSTIPGGSYQTRGNSETFCILDCVYGGGERRRVGDAAVAGDDDAMEEDGGNANDDNGGGYFVVLDVMAWNGAETYGCDVEFRSFWLQSKFASEIDSCAVTL